MSNQRQHVFTPYLSKRARLSQVWINRWTLLLLLVLLRFLIAVANVDHNLASARKEALQACIQVENAGSSMASMPHYMAIGVNKLTAGGIEKAVNGLMTLLDIAVTSVEEIVIFVVHMMTSTYLCLITLAIRGSIKAVADVSGKVSDSLQKTIDEISDGLSDTSKSLTDSLDDIENKLRSVPFMDDFKPPTIDFTNQIDKLKSLQVPPELQEGVNKMQDSMPTFEDVQNFIDNLIRIPFGEVKKQIQGSGAFHFNRDLLPIPEKHQLSFCSKGNSISDFFDGLILMVGKARTTALIVLIILAILACIPVAWVEYRRSEEIESIRSATATTEQRLSNYDISDLIYRVIHPLSFQWVHVAFQGSKQKKNAIRWFIAYITSIPMLFLLSIGLAGLLSCLSQFLVVKCIQKAVPQLTGHVIDFTKDVTKSLESDSFLWSSGVNDVVHKLDKRLNHDIFGFVNITTTAVNDTLDAFVDKTNKELDDAFGSTVLHDPIKDVLNCLIGLKIASFQKGLTWVQNHAHISFPDVRDDIFSLGALAQSNKSNSAAEFFASPDDAARDEITEAVARVVDTFVNNIRKEALVSAVFVGFWVFVTVGGAIYIGLASARRKRGPQNITIAGSRYPG